MTYSVPFTLVLNQNPVIIGEYVCRIGRVSFIILEIFQKILKWPVNENTLCIYLVYYFQFMV
jgi:hypothetical protein